MQALHANRGLQACTILIECLSLSKVKMARSFDLAISE